MPACRQCGKQNPEGTVFCGYCAASLAPAKPAGASSPNPSAESLSKPAEPSIAKHEIRQSAPPKIFKPESKTQPAAPVPARGGGGFELLPWNKLSPTQKAGRAVAGLILLLLIFFFVRGIFRGMGPSSRPGAAPQPQGATDTMTDSDRSDGIESLCKVFQIYGMPRTEDDAAASARNAAQLYKLAGNQSPERSAFILTSVVEQFRSGKLTEDDCAQVGHPLKTAGNANNAPAAAPGDRIGGIPPPPPANSPNSGATR